MGETMLPVSSRMHESDSLSARDMTASSLKRVSAEKDHAAMILSTWRDVSAGK